MALEFPRQRKLTALFPNHPNSSKSAKTKEKIEVLFPKTHEITHNFAEYKFSQEIELRYKDQLKDYSVCCLSVNCSVVSQLNHHLRQKLFQYNLVGKGRPRPQTIKRTNHLWNAKKHQIDYWKLDQTSKVQPDDKIAQFQGHIWHNIHNTALTIPWEHLKACI